MTDVQGALPILRRAVENERQGYHFYQEAAARADDARGKAMFESLGNDETRHLHLLLAEYQSLQKGEGWIDPQDALEREIEIDVSQPLFPEEQMAPVAFPWEEASDREWDELQTDLAVLRFGMEMEERFYEMYKAALGEAAPDSRPASAYRFLMSEENCHFTLLQDAHNYLAENEVWWDDWQRPIFEGG